MEMRLQRILHPNDKKVLQEIYDTLLQARVTKERLGGLLYDRFPVRCYCNNIIGTVSDMCFFFAGSSIKKKTGWLYSILNELNIRKECCRIRFLCFPPEPFPLFSRYDLVIPLRIFRNIKCRTDSGTFPILMSFRGFRSQWCAYGGHYEVDESFQDKDFADRLYLQLCFEEPLYSSPWYQRQGLSHAQIEHEIRVEKTQPLFWNQLCLTFEIQNQLLFLVWDLERKSLSIVGHTDSTIDKILGQAIQGLNQRFFGQGKFTRINFFKKREEKRQVQERLFLFLYSHLAVCPNRSLQEVLLDVLRHRKKHWPGVCHAHKKHMQMLDTWRSHVNDDARKMIDQLTVTEHTQYLKEALLAFYR